jgi:hypothetical protein
MSECHHSVLTELWNNRKAVISLDKITKVEEILSTLQHQQDYIDQLKLALELSSNSLTSNVENFASLNTIPEDYLLVSHDNRKDTSLSLSIPVYPGQGFKNLADCRIFSSNLLALQDCYENVVLNIDISTPHRLALQLKIKGYLAQKQSPTELDNNLSHIISTLTQSQESAFDKRVSHTMLDYMENRDSSVFLRRHYSIDKVPLLRVGILMN